jgi:glycosyltransferase involved in cell wall biosynthesis
MPKISVIICTHNPRQDYMHRTLESLRLQSLPVSDWELLVIDNASTEPVSGRFELSWHPNGRHVVEPELGLTPARLCGISQARAALLQFVDDDNVLDPDYLEQALLVGQDFPWLGVWGGQQTGEFEVEPSPKLLPYIEMLAIRKVERAKWSNLYTFETTPIGAGMVIRAEIAREYRSRATSNEQMKGLDRKGSSLASAGDVDMAWTAIDLGWSTGVFPQLHLVHLITKGRLTEEYFIRLKSGIMFSGTIVEQLRGVQNPYKSGSGFRRFFSKIFRWFYFDRFTYRMFYAEREAREKAYQFLRSMR